MAIAWHRSTVPGWSFGGTVSEEVESRYCPICGMPFYGDFMHHRCPQEIIDEIDRADRKASFEPEFEKRERLPPIRPSEVDD